MNVALVLSGGIGTRLGSDIPKQYQEVAGKPILVHTLEQIQRCEEFDHIVVTAASKWKVQIRDWKDAYHIDKLRTIASAGSDRQLSIRNGLIAAQSLMDNADGGVVVQDAVRPLASLDLFRRLIAGLREAPCVLPVLPMTDTVYISQDGQWVDGLLDRSTIYAGQAPEAFRYQDYLRLYKETPLEVLSAMSGSCQLPCSKGWKVKMIPGEWENIKITYLSDLETCEKLLMEREMTR